MTVLYPEDPVGRAFGRVSNRQLRWPVIAAISLDLALWATIIGVVWKLFS